MSRPIEDVDIQVVVDGDAGNVAEQRWSLLVLRSDRELRPAECYQRRKGRLITRSALRVCTCGNATKKTHGREAMGHADE
jgi:hypothetical protein